MRTLAYRPSSLGMVLSSLVFLVTAACDETTGINETEDKDGVNLIPSPGKSTGATNPGSGGGDAGGAGMGGGTQGQPCTIQPDCDDQNACTIDNCVSGKCEQQRAEDDGNACTTDSCNPDTGLITNTPVIVDDMNPCTFDSCDLITGVANPTEIPVFEEHFDNNVQGWALGPQWTIGSAAASMGAKDNGNDPSSDHSAQGDGVAGTALGGLVMQVATTIMTSPPISLASVKAGEKVGLRVWRYLNVDALPDVATIELSVDGTSSQTLWTSGASATGVIDNPAGPAGAGNGGGGWVEMRFDLTASVAGNVGTANPIRVRFTYSKGSGMPSMGGWNVDDFSIVRQKVAFDGDQCTTDGCQAQDVNTPIPLNGALTPGDPTAMCESVACATPTVGVLTCTPAMP
ncbi:MAG: hypothetical protein U0271_02105 [Polyangiaceae bacterium]